MKNLPRLGTSLASLCILTVMACAQQIVVNVNGQDSGTQSAEIVNGVTLVPLRAVSEMLGAQVQWNQDNQSIDITQAGTNINMRIDQSNAMVGGQNVTLDVPPEVVNGQTLVPLRFIAEAFGAYVQYDPVAHTVNINTNGTHQQTIRTQYHLERAMAPLDFSDDASGWVTSGTAIHFTLNAQPGGQATVVIPSLNVDVPMQETTPGHYVASWSPPAGTPLTVNSATAMAKLDYNGKVYYSTHRDFNLNNQSPIVQSIMPSDGAIISGFQPTITVNYGNDISGVDTGRVHLWVNGQEVTGASQINGSSLTYAFPSNLPPGVYHAKLTAYDRAGNQITKEWSFTATGNQDTADFTTTGTGTLRRGDDIGFSLKGAPGSQVTVNVQNGPSIPLTETSAGVFTGDYRVRRDDEFGGNLVTATIVPPNGQTYTIQCKQRLGVSGDISPRSMAPVIASPLATDEIGDDMVVTGTAPPASTVDIDVAYTSRIGKHGTVSNSLAHMTVRADTGGNFRTDHIHIPHTARNSKIRITATTVLPDGTESPATELVLPARR